MYYSGLSKVKRIEVSFAQRAVRGHDRCLPSAKLIEPDFRSGFNMTTDALTSTSIAIRPSVPWWETADSALVSQLELERVPQDDNHQLEGDVVVIGAGIAGLSAASSAAAQGARVILLEKTPMIGLGASGQNAGIVCVGCNMPLANIQPGSPAAALWEETTVLAEELFKEAKMPGALMKARKTGSLFLAKSRTAAKRLRGEVKLRNRAGLAAEIISAQEAKQLSHGWLNVAGVHAAQLLPDEGRAHPLSLLATLAKRARMAGAKLYGCADVVAEDEVSRTSVRQDRWQITLKGGMRVKARALIRCTGPIVEANARIFALSFARQMPDDFPVFQDAAPFTYYDYRIGDGFVTVSGGRYARAGGGPSDERYWQNMESAAKSWLPQFKADRPAYRWAVDLNVTADMIPELKPLSKSAPAVAVVGLGALGVLPGIALGRRAGKQMVASL
jgi:glycine/D-amino acid oxidase-like deaminating enzyme